MISLIFLQKPLKVTMLTSFCLMAVFLLAGMKSSATSKQCYTATYSIVSDYSNEGLPLNLKKIFAKQARENRYIYKIIQSPSNSFELIDSIAHICGARTIMVKPEIIIREMNQESVDYYYQTKTENKCYTVKEPEYLDGWKIIGPISYKKRDDRYFKATKESSDDYVIFDSNTPVPHNLKLIRGIPGLVIEASIGIQRMKLLEFKASSCSQMANKIKQFQDIERIKVKRKDYIDFSFMNSDTDLITNDKFECVESF